MLLKQADALRLTLAPDHPLKLALHNLRIAYSERDTGLVPW
jgi:hypothetical protein